jgi:hypothetical protein
MVSVAHLHPAIDILTKRVVGMRISERKRHCRDSSDTEIAPEEEAIYFKTDSFLANSMRSLINYTGLSVDAYTSGLEQDERVSEEGLANIVRDAVVEAWCSDLETCCCCCSTAICKNNIPKKIQSVEPRARNK